MTVAEDFYCYHSDREDTRRLSVSQRAEDLNPGTRADPIDRRFDKLARFCVSSYRFVVGLIPFFSLK